MKPEELEKLSTSIHESLGMASMCWSETPTGVFESTRASEIGKNLVETVQSIIATLEQTIAEKDAEIERMKAPVDMSIVNKITNPVRLREIIEKDRSLFSALTHTWDSIESSLRSELTQAHDLILKATSYVQTEMLAIETLRNGINNRRDNALLDGEMQTLCNIETILIGEVKK